MLTIVTINLHGRERWLKRRPLLIAQLLPITPDVIALQEVDFFIGQGRWVRTQLNERLKVQDHHGKPTPSYRLIQKRNGLAAKGVAILSQLPLLSYDALPLGGGQTALRVNLELPSRKTVDVVTMQLNLTPYAIEGRADQVTAMMGWMRSHRRTRLQIAAGDFNESANGLAIRRMKDGFRSAYEAANGREPTATYPTAVVQENVTAVCRDYIFLSPAIKQVQSAKLCCKKNTDTAPHLYPSTHVGLFTECKV